MSTAEWEVITLYPFRKAPVELQELSHFGGDEDLVIVVPTSQMDGKAWRPVERLIDTHRGPEPQRVELEDKVVYILARS